MENKIHERILELHLLPDALIATEYTLLQEEVSSMDDEALMEEVEELMQGLLNNSDQDMRFSLSLNSAIAQYYDQGILTPDNRKAVEGAYILIYGKSGFGEYPYPEDHSIEAPIVKHPIFTPQEIIDLQKEDTDDEEGSEE